MIKEHKHSELENAAEMKPGGPGYLAYRTRPFTPYWAPKASWWTHGKGGTEYSINTILHFCLLLRSLPIKDGARILDLGTGGGWTSEWLARWGYHVVSVDIGREYAAIAHERAAADGQIDLCPVQADAENLPFDSDSFDIIIFYDSLHHLSHYQSALREAYRVLRPGGWLAASEPGDASRADKEQELIERTGILESGFNPRRLQRELKRIGFSRCYLRLNPYWHHGYRTPRPIKRLGLNLTGLALDMAVYWAMPWYLLLGVLRGTVGFKITAQKQ